MSLSASPTVSMSWSTLRSMSTFLAPGNILWCLIGKAMASNTVILGLSEENGSWKIIDMRLPRICWNSSSEIFIRSIPS
jgi:hypothetical protein